MNHQANEILKKALTLPADERAELAGSLIESLDTAEDDSVKAAWEKEIARRMRELDSAEVEPVPQEQARRRLKSAAE